MEADDKGLRHFGRAELARDGIDLGAEEDQLSGSLTALGDGLLGDLESSSRGRGRGSS